MEVMQRWRLDGGAHSGGKPLAAGSDFGVVETFCREHERGVTAGNDGTARLDDDLVGLDAVFEILDLGLDAGAGFAALLGDGEVAEDVTAGVTDQTGEIHQQVVAGVVDDPVVTERRLFGSLVRLYYRRECAT